MTIQNITPILTNLYEIYTEAEIAAWLETPQAMLDNQTPEAVIAAGGYQRVLDLSQLIADGIYL